MAAQPVKTSPSNQKMHQGEDNTAPSKNNQQALPQLKDPPTMMKEAPADVQQQQEAKEGNQAASAIAGTNTNTSTNTSTTGAGNNTPTIPTYFSSATSEIYALAKQLLNAGNFEEALSLIEQGLENTKTELRVRLSLTANTNENENDEELERSIEFNGSVAPFHYLYGTTLLYSLEEAKEDGQDNGGMTVENNSSINSASAAAAENNNTPMAQMLSSLSSDQGGGGGGTEQQQQQPDVDFAEDIQIAWENLDLARNIIQKMIGEGNVLSETDVAKLQL